MAKAFFLLLERSTWNTKRKLFFDFVDTRRTIGLFDMRRERERKIVKKKKLCFFFSLPAERRSSRCIRLLKKENVPRKKKDLIDWQMSTKNSLPSPSCIVSIRCKSSPCVCLQSVHAWACRSSFEVRRFVNKIEEEEKRRLSHRIASLSVSLTRECRIPGVSHRWTSISN